MKPGNAGGRKEPWFKTAQEAATERALENLISPQDKVQKLQAALHAKAKAEPAFRFYQLYDKVYRQDVLALAYQRCKSNGGVAGVDGQSFEDIKEYGVERWLGELAERVRKKGYKPEAVKRVWIPKPNGKLRPLGIPTIADRVVQTALMLVIEPIFEADLQPELPNSTRIELRGARCHRSNSQSDHYGTHNSHRGGFGRLLRANSTR